MSIELRLPTINGTDKEQLAQIRSYLYQLVPQLQWALSTIDSSASQNYVASQAPRVASSSSNTPFNTEVAFAELKPLIIKSADIVQAYYEKINEKLQGLYVAESDFGTFVEQTEQNISKNSTNITQAFKDVQQIFTDIENLDFTLSETNAYIRTGKLYEDNGHPVYGLEIGQTTKADGNEVFNHFARFTPDRLSFFDKNGTEIAYISNYRLYISNVEITSSFTIGGFVDTVTANGGIVTKWVGRG